MALYKTIGRTDRYSGDRLKYETRMPPEGACIWCWLGGEMTFWEGMSKTNLCPGNGHAFRPYKGDSQDVIDLSY